MKHFVTLFPEAENVHLVKDVGQIPYQMHRLFGYCSTLVCYKNSSKYPYAKKEVKGLSIEFIENEGKKFFWEKAVPKYLFKNSKSIDILNLYHLTPPTMLYGIIYKLLNPGGILYIKLDFNIHDYLEYGFRFSNNKLKDTVYRFIFSLFLYIVDILSVETREAVNVLKKRGSRFKKVLTYLPNGIDETWLQTDGANGNLYQKKENIILTVGRIGAFVKNHRFLLKALKKLNLENWEVIFVGPIDKAFESKINKFYAQNKNKTKQVTFAGHIDDRNKLYSFYRRAKIFCLPSKSEGFPIVLVEALNFGNYIIGTERISSINEMTDNERLGQIIPLGDISRMRETLKKVTAEDFYDKHLMEDILHFSKNYRWKKIIPNLHHVINKLNR